MIAPTTMHKLAHPEGEMATARAATATGTTMVFSSSTTSIFEEVVANCDVVCFFQLYVDKNRSISVVIVQRAERASYKAIILKANTPKLGHRETDIRKKFIVPSLKNLEALLSINMDTEESSGLASYASQTLDSSLGWKDIKWLQSLTSLPILIKGILTAEDAELAIQDGFAGIIVSNHGVHQLDFVSSTIVSLEEDTKVVRGRSPCTI